ncbi:outer membrane protein assembly factor BamC [Kingella negevensis]|uniref:outer membrane protein assembly factor BamC n=1 Tax=Kingella negevensis TaxID=1522312 RepID=UPI0025429B91|nr:outer membrane protein assembly factor BamC [Kingella negevensis]WII92736.1 outer membrane protein assembly factor BamC [Kingella negevensis]
MKPTKTLALALLMTSLAACSGSKKDKPKLDYQSENNKIVNLEVPPDLNDPRNGDLYSLPKGTIASPNAMKQTAGKANKAVLATVKDAYIERSGTQRWLVVKNKSAAEMWPLLRAFWQEAGFTIYSEEPQAGLMETEWAENRAKLPSQGLRRLFDAVGMGGVYTTSERDKFLIRMERSQSGDGVDVFFTHKGLEEVFDSKKEESTVWQPRANDPNLEAAFLARFMQYLGVDEAAIDRQMQTQIDQSKGTAFAKIDGDSVIVYGAPERNVNRVASALDRVGLTVQQFVSERGMFVVRPAPSVSETVTQAEADNKKPSRLARLFGKKDTSETETSTASTQAAQMYIGLEALENGQRVVLLDQFGKPMTGINATKWLEALYRELK